MTKTQTISTLLLLLGLLIACSSDETPTPQTIIETVVVTEEVPGETVEKVVTPTPEPTSPPEPAGPRTLTYCMGTGPDTLNPLVSGNLQIAIIHQAIFDGPIDNRRPSASAVHQ